MGTIPMPRFVFFLGESQFRNSRRVLPGNRLIEPVGKLPGLGYVSRGG
jgi:hypothetical protein